MEDKRDIIKKIREVESRLAKQFQKISQIQARTLNINPGVGPWFGQLFPVGSLKEGTLFAKCFRLSHVLSIVEFDFMAPMGKVNNAHDELVPIEQSPGYFTFTTNHLLRCMNSDVRNKYHEWQSGHESQNEDRNSQSSVLKFVKSLVSKKETDRQAYECIIDRLLQLGPAEASKAETFDSIEGPSAFQSIKISSAGKLLFEVQLDTVPCIQLSTWPDQSSYEEWSNRKRNWPSPELVAEVQHLLYIVAKTPPKSEEESETPNAWRLSFSKAEVLLTSTYTENQQDIYFLFKIMFYANIKTLEIDEKRMSSYFCKTTMLWMMEEEGSKFGEDFAEAIIMLFGKLNQFLKSGFLPSFFCPSVNLLAGYPEELIAFCCCMIGEITEKPSHYIPLVLDQAYDELKKWEDRIDTLHLDVFVDGASRRIEHEITSENDAFLLLSQFVRLAI